MKKCQAHRNGSSGLNACLMFDCGIMFAETYLHKAAMGPRNRQVGIQAKRTLDKGRAVIEVTNYIGKHETTE